ncbi:MAG: ATP-binding protein [bacterium]
MGLVIIEIISLTVQFAAALIAFKLIRITEKRKLVWIIISTALFLMFMRRGITFITLLSQGIYPSGYSLSSELISLATSICMVLVVALMAPIFKSIKSSEEEAKRINEELNQVLNNAVDGIVIIDKYYTIRRINQKFAHKIGIRRDESIGKKCHEIIKNPVCHTSHCPLTEICRDVDRVACNMEISNRNGNKITFIFTGTPFISPSGEFIGVIETFKDITEHKWEEEAQRLKRERERLSTILDGNPIPTFVINNKHQVISWNLACERLTGVSKQRAIGKKVDSGIFYRGEERPVMADLVLDNDLTALNKYYKSRNLSRSSIVQDAFEASDKLKINGIWKNIYFLAARLLDQKGNVIGAIETLQDITEKEQLRKQLEQTQKMEAIGTLVDGVAHDLSNILTVVSIYSNIAMEKIENTSPLYNKLKKIDIAQKRATNLIRQLLLFSRKEPRMLTSVDINSLITNLLKMLTRLIGEHIAIETNFSSNLWVIQADEGNIEQVIMNLVLNARDAMLSGGKITITTKNIIINGNSCQGNSGSRPGNYVHLSIIDTGSGMDKNVMQHIFEPFFTTKEVGKGSGMGLSVVYGIVKQHEGWIDVASKVNRGTTINIYFPAFFGKVENGSIKINLLSEYKGQGERILMVEDDENMRESSVLALRENGYEAIGAATAQDALTLFVKEKGEFHVVISDLLLPDINGLELVAKLHSLKPGVSILLISGYTEERTKSSPLFSPEISAKNIPFLQKPYNLLELLKAVKRACPVSAL